MGISPNVEAVLRQCSKDENAYQQLLALFQNQQTSKEQCSFILNNIKDIVFQISGIGNWQYLGASWEVVTGFSIASTLGKSFLNYIHPEDQDKSRTLFDEVISQKKEYFRNQCRYHTADGRLIHFEVYARLVYEHGQSPSVIGILRDITERKAVEAALKQSKERLNTLFSATPDIIFRISADGTYLDHHVPNPTLLWDGPKDFLGQNVADMVPEPQATSIIQNIQKALATQQPVEQEYNFIAHNQQQRYEIRIVPSGNDEVLCIVRNITEFWLIKQNLQTVFDHLEFAVETARIAWWEMDIETGKVRYDKRKVLMAGYSPEDFTDVTYHAFTDLIHPDDHAAVIESMHDLLLGRSSLYSIDYRLKTALGDWIWFHDHGEIEWTTDKRKVVRGYIIDITERKQAEQRELELALEKERIGLIASFVQNAAHEFRTPLSTINTSAYLLAHIDQPSARSTESQKIQHQVQRITKLVNMLLTIVKLQSTDRMTFTSIDINTICDVAFQHIKANCGKEIQWHYRKAEQLPLIIGNATFLIEAIQQLLDNACRFTPPSGNIILNLWSKEGWVWLEIADSGPGIEPDRIPNIFEMLWRDDHAHTTPGFGLGLSITKRVLDIHGGVISVESTIGQGTTFLIGIPSPNAR